MNTPHISCQVYICCYRISSCLVTRIHLRIVVIFRFVIRTEMEFQLGLPEFRVLATVVILWLPNVLKVYSRHIDTHGHDLFLSQNEKSQGAYAAVDHYISERLRELFNRQEKRDRSNIARYIYNRNTISLNDVKDNETRLSETSRVSKESSSEFINGTGTEKIKLQKYLHSKTFEIKTNSRSDKTYSKLHTDSKANMKDANKNMFNDREMHSAEQSLNKVIDHIPNTNTTSNTKNIKSKRGLSPDSCETETLVFDLEFRKHISIDTSSYLLICKGPVSVSKCEGLCNSSVSPSVNHYDGFQRVRMLEKGTSRQ